DRKVVAVGSVLQLDLPVAAELEPVRADDLDRVAAALLEEPVDPRPGVAEELLQRLGLVIEGGEYQAAVGLGTQLLQRQVALVQYALVAVRVRDASQGTIEAVGPGVVGAGEPVGLALWLLAEAGAAVTAAVEQRVQAALAVAGDDDRL